MEHLNTHTAAGEIDLSSDLLNRIDQLLTPHVTTNIAENTWNHSTAVLNPAFRRR